MSLTTTLACAKLAMVSQEFPNQNYSTGVASFNLSQETGEKRVLFSFEDFPNNLRDYAIKSAKIVVQFSDSLYGTNTGFYQASAGFTQNTVTWATKPDLEYFAFSWPGGSGAQNMYQCVLSLETSRLTAPAFAIAQLKDYNWPSILENDLSNISLVVEYDPDVTVSCALSAGAMNGMYVNPREKRWMTWVLYGTGGRSYNSTLGYTQQSASFFWKESGAANYNEIQIAGSTQRVDIPANTLPVGKTIQYYVQVINNLGQTLTSPVYSFTTADSAVTATPVEPINTLEDGSGPITFRWTVSSPNGTTPTGADLQGSADGTTWTTFGQVSGSARTFIAPASTFSSGTKYWRVRAYNLDGVAGAWSAAVSFISVAAPAAPVVNTNAAPFATISWSSAEQQAWRLTVDEKIYGPFFGSAKSFTLPDYLADGEHRAFVEVQGQYGLWSEPGSVFFIVSNSEGDAITLSAIFDIDGELSWSTNGTTEDYLIYRDGVQIGHTDKRFFVDRLALGEHSYRVVNRLAGRNYSLSNIVNGTMSTEISQIAPAAGGTWLPLKLSENSNAQQIFNWSQTHSLRHMMGAEYPVLELSPYMNASGTYDTAFSDPAQAAEFEALRGQIVILKSRRGNVLIGGMLELRKREGNFFPAYEFTITRCHWEDYVDDANG